MRATLIFLNLEEPLTAWDCYNCQKRNFTEGDQRGQAVKCCGCGCDQVISKQQPAGWTGPW